MAKIKFADDVGGSGEYEVTYNPVEVIVPQSMDEQIKKTVNTIDGEGITFTPYHDSRRGKLIWRGFPGDHTNFITQLSEIVTYVDGYKYIKFDADLATALGVYATYTKVKIIAVNKKIRPGGAIIYDSVEIVWEEAE